VAQERGVTMPTLSRAVLRNPIRADLAASHADAHTQLRRAAALDVTALTALRAKRRRHKIKALLRFLDRTDHLCTSEVVPCHDERERLIGPVLAALEKLAKRAPARRDRTLAPTTKETPMPMDHCLIAGHPHHPGHGCVVDDPHAPPPAPPSNGAAAPGFPPALMPDILAFEGVFAVPNFEAVRTQRALDLSRRLLDFPDRERVALVARMLYRLAMRAARSGAA